MSGCGASSLPDRLDDGKPGAHRPLGVVFVGLRIAEIDENAVAHVLRHEAAAAIHRLCDAFLIAGNDFPEVLRVHAVRQCSRTDKVGEHHGDLAALGGSLRDGRSTRCWSGQALGRRRSWPCFGIRLRAQRSDGVEQQTAVPDDADAQILQVLRRQALQDPLVDFIVAERRLIPFEAKATQPLPEVHSRALNSPLARNHRPGETMCPGGHDASSLDHLVGAGHQRRGHSHAHRLSGLEVDHQLELGRLFDRDVGNFDAAEELDELSGHYL